MCHSGWSDDCWLNGHGPWWCCDKNENDEYIPCDACGEDLCGPCIGADIVTGGRCTNAIRLGIQKGKEVIKKITNVANFTTNGSHGAFMEFDDYPREPLVKFDDFASVDQFNKKVDGVYEACRGGTDIILALNASLSKIFNYPNGPRDNTEKVALLITDGKDGNPKELYKEMKEEFKKKDITLIVIAVGDIDEEKLGLLLQSPNYLFPANDWDELDDRLIKAITAVICEGNTC